EAIRAANDSPFGLGAAVFTRDTARGERVGRELDVGSCFVNALVRSDPRLPFGGVKESGYGRELADFGIHEFVNIKTAYIKKVARAPPQEIESLTFERFRGEQLTPLGPWRQLLAT